MKYLSKLLSDKYFCNFSLFQSLPDMWAVDQLFPIMPIHRLHEKPMREGTLQDITCDSDGKIDKFIGTRDAIPNLPLHEFKENETVLSRCIFSWSISGNSWGFAQLIW